MDRDDVPDGARFDRDAGNYDNQDVGCTWNPKEVASDYSDESRNVTYSCCFCIVLILAIILLSCSLETVDSTEQVWLPPQSLRWRLPRSQCPFRRLSPTILHRPSSETPS